MEYKSQPNNDKGKIKHSKKSVGMQTIIPSRFYISPAMLATHKLPIKDYPKFLYTSHTIIFMLAFIVAYIAVADRLTTRDFMHNAKMYSTYLGACSASAYSLYFLLLSTFLIRY